MRIAILIISIFVLFKALPAAANFSEAGPASCQSRTITPQNLETVDLPEVHEAFQNTGIQIVSIKQQVYYEGLKYNLNLHPANAVNKAAIAKRVTGFLKMLPPEFFKKSSQVCFIVVDEIKEFQAITTGHIIIMPADSSLDAIAHEFMHALDDLHEKKYAFQNWDEINDAGNCNYDKDINLSAPFQENSLDYNCFITPYAKTDLYEDHAEVFAALMTKSSRIKTQPNRQPGPIAAKAEDIKKYLEIISESVNEEFWNSFEQNSQP